ncbi:sensor domain-containing diguanylate cyclase [Vibrio maerlii]|uniref:GGDEF domain-containing protein n=1 Tax=Vibrio maerlii TaxID=2231648 RepID=UPI000E3E7047|nr:GGDEF domain-containing protein [Vibrio maerlii]
MEQLISKILDSGIDVTSTKNEQALLLWEHVKQHIASNSHEKAYCHLAIAEWRHRLGQPRLSVDELRSAIRYLDSDAELTIDIKQTLSERLIAIGEYGQALNEYVDLTNLAIEHGFIDHYVRAVLGMGELCEAYGDDTRALRYYQKIESIDHAIMNRALRLKYKLHIIACNLRQGHYASARDMQVECEDLSIMVNDPALQGEVILNQAILLRSDSHYVEALQCLSQIANLAAQHKSSWLSAQVNLEKARSLIGLDRIDAAMMLLHSSLRHISPLSSPLLVNKLYQAISQIYADQDRFKDALAIEKKSYQVESDLLKRVPISDLGPQQLRRLARFELQLKLILSEQENRELKVTTETQKDAVEKLKQDVYTDPLTGLHNRRWLDIKLKDLILHDNDFTFLVVDIDHFKSINDELSHLVGDKAITSVATELAKYFRFKGASCIRFGGEEFLVILENHKVPKAVMHAENYRQRIMQFNWEPILGDRNLTVSIGVTEHRPNENTQQTFYRADKALYQAKAQGRNQVCSES